MLSFKFVEPILKSPEDALKPVPLRARVLRAGAWTLGSYAAGQFIRLGSNLIMTRLLMPEMFGLMALAHVLIAGLHMFSDLGLHHSVVQHQRGDDPVFLDTVWTVQIVRGGVIWLAALGLSAAVLWLKSAPLVAGGQRLRRPAAPPNYRRALIHCRDRRFPIYENRHS